MVQRLLELSSFLLGLSALFIALSFATKGADFLPSARRSWRESRTNLLFFFFDGLVIAPIIILPALFLARYLPHLPTMPLPSWAMCVFAVIVGDFAGYWRHRLQHTRLLWPAHAVHHSDRHLTFLSLVRMHPLDRLSTVTLDSLTLLLLGFPYYAVALNGIVRTLYGHFEHADLKLTYPVFISPIDHRWHHSLETPGKNFATLFTFWDRAFGTYHAASEPPTRLGIEDTPRGFFGEILRPVDVRQYL